MSKQEIGPREKAMREMREQRQGKYAPRASVDELRAKVSKIKPTKKARKRG